MSDVDIYFTEKIYYDISEFVKKSRNEIDKAKESNFQNTSSTSSPEDKYTKFVRLLLFPPLTPKGRYLVHKAVENFPFLKSLSVGQDPFRRTAVTWRHFFQDEIPELFAAESFAPDEIHLSNLPLPESYACNKVLNERKLLEKPVLLSNALIAPDVVNHCARLDRVNVTANPINSEIDTECSDAWDCRCACVQLNHLELIEEGFINKKKASDKCLCSVDSKDVSSVSEFDNYSVGNKRTELKSFLGEKSSFCLGISSIEDSLEKGSNRPVINMVTEESAIYTKKRGAKEGVKLYSPPGARNGRNHKEEYEKRKLRSSKEENIPPIVFHEVGNSSHCENNMSNTTPKSRAKRPDQQFYVPRRRRQGECFPFVSTSPEENMRPPSPTNSICSVVSEFSGRNRYSRNEKRNNKNRAPLAMNEKCNPEEIPKRQIGLFSRDTLQLLERCLNQDSDNICNPAYSSVSFTDNVYYNTPNLHPVHSKENVNRNESIPRMTREKRYHKKNKSQAVLNPNNWDSSNKSMNCHSNINDSCKEINKDNSYCEDYISNSDNYKYDKSLSEEEYPIQYGSPILKNDTESIEYSSPIPKSDTEFLQYSPPILKNDAESLISSNEQPEFKSFCNGETSLNSSEEPFPCKTVDSSIEIGDTSNSTDSSILANPPENFSDTLPDLAKENSSCEISPLNEHNPKRFSFDWALESERVNEDSWDSLYDDSGNCLDPIVMKELSNKFGKVKIEEATNDYGVLKPDIPRITEEEYGHVIEIFDFPASFKTQDIVTLFQGQQTVDIRWVDDTHALGVFSTPFEANQALAANYPFIKTRPLSAGTQASKAKAIRITDTLLPYKPRPETSAFLAHRLVSGALGLKVAVSKEEREAQREKLRNAKEKRRKIARLKEEAWEGTLQNLA